MNWILDTYSEVYNVAMHKAAVAERSVANAKTGRVVKAGKLLGLLGWSRA